MLYFYPVMLFCQPFLKIFIFFLGMRICIFFSTNATNGALEGSLSCPKMNEDNEDRHNLESTHPHGKHQYKLA